MPPALVSTGSLPVQSLSYPVGRSHYEGDGTDARGKTRGGGGGGASATDAALALSKLPVLAWFRDGVAPALAILVIIANLATLVFMVHYFRTSCTSEYGVLPNESGDFVPPSLANLADQGGVTIISRSLVFYQANNTFTQEGLNFWHPFERTCGCSECDLASCSATIPIVVEYEQCNPWAEELDRSWTFDPNKCNPYRGMTLYIGCPSGPYTCTSQTARYAYVGGAVVGERVYRVRQHGVGCILRPGYVGDALRAEERGDQTYLLGLCNIFVRAVGPTGPAERAVPIRLGVASDAPSSSSTRLFFQLGCRAAIPPYHRGVVAVEL